ncbi:MAG: septation protein SepH, partial [Actinomadura sp.]
MQELRLVAVSEDGSYLVLATSGRGTRFTLPVDDRLRAAVRGHFSRLGQFEIEVESPLRPKEIQARIRAGETAEEIAESAGIPVERVRWFEGPVLQEREYMAQQAQRVAVRRQGESSPGPPLGEMVEERLGRRGIDLEEVEWDSWKYEDSTWRLRLSFFDDGRPHAAEWVFDPRRRSVSPLDEEAALLSSLDLDEKVTDTVTPLAPRRAAMKVVPDSPITAARRERPAEPRFIAPRGQRMDPAEHAEHAEPEMPPVDEPGETPDVVADADPVVEPVTEMVTEAVPEPDTEASVEPEPSAEPEPVAEQEPVAEPVAKPTRKAAPPAAKAPKPRQPEPR